MLHSHPLEVLKDSLSLYESTLHKAEDDGFDDLWTTRIDGLRKAIEVLEHDAKTGS